MFAVIEDGSRQYRVQQGQTVTIDFRAEAQDGDKITFDRVLLANAGGASTIGRPVIETATVEAEVVEPLSKGPKIEVQKIRRRKNSRRHTGHRQKYTTVRVTGINVPGLEIVEMSEPSTQEVAVETTVASGSESEESAPAIEADTSDSVLPDSEERPDNDATV